MDNKTTYQALTTQIEEQKYTTDNKQVDTEASVDDDIDKSKETEVIYRIYDKDQTIPKKAHNRREERLNEVDPNWKYNITLGDLELRRITHYDGKEETLWFPMEEYPDDYDDGTDINDENKKRRKRGRKLKPARKVFVSFKVKRIYDIDADSDSFRMRFHMYFNWVATEAEYKNYYKVSELAKQNDEPETLANWEPFWYPHLEFQNAVEQYTKEWEVYPEEGRFRLQTFKDFGQEKSEKIPDNQFDCTKARFIRAKLECEMLFAEELELQGFPFDCQDLTCIIHERTTGGVRCVFLPELRKQNFGSVDPRYSLIDGWNLETGTIDFGDADSSASRSKSSYAMIVLTLKISRMWRPVVINTVLIMFLVLLLSFTVFSVDYQDVSDRLGLSLTLLLTAVLFDTKKEATSYLQFLDKYILVSYGFLTLLMFENAVVAAFFDQQADDIMFWVLLGIFVVYHIAFIIHGMRVRKGERGKFAWSADEVEKQINLKSGALRFDYTKRRRTGDNDRLLSFIGYIVASYYMDEKQRAALENKQHELDKIMYS